MKHKLVFGLCITVFLLTGAVISTVALMLFERQNIALLQQRITELSAENATLRHRLDDADRAQNTTQEHQKIE